VWQELRISLRPSCDFPPLEQRPIFKALPEPRALRSSGKKKFCRGGPLGGGKKPPTLQKCKARGQTDYLRPVTALVRVPTGGLAWKPLFLPMGALVVTHPKTPISFSHSLRSKNNVSDAHRRGVVGERVMATCVSVQRNLFCSPLLHLFSDKQSACYV